MVGTFGFEGPLEPGDEFGRSVCAVGDVNGDGIEDLAVGAPGDDIDAPGGGAVWILFLDVAGNVVDEVKIGAAVGLGQVPQVRLRFGESIAAMGDLDGDGTPDIAVGAPGVSGSPTIIECSLLYLNPDGTVRERVGVSRGALGGSLPLYGFGRGLAALDLNGDGRLELAVGDPAVTGVGGGATDVYTVFLNSTGTVQSYTSTNTSVVLYGLGHCLANVGDRNGDGIPELAVGNPFSDAFGSLPLAGELHLIFMNTDGSQQSSLILGPGSGGFGGIVGEDDKFGLQVTEIADLDGNGVTDLAVAANDAWQFPAYFAPGVVWLLFMQADGTVLSETLIAPGLNGFTGPLATRDHFGEGLAWTHHGFGAGTLWAGSHGDDSSGNEAGAVWRLTLDGVSNPPAAVVRNGTHLNPVGLESTSLPLVDSTWTAAVNTAVLPTATSTFLVGYEDPAQLLLPFGELLVLIEPLGTNVFVDEAPVFGGFGQHSLPIPDDLSFVGREIHVQGLLAGGGLLLTNAVELTIGAL